MDSVSILDELHNLGVAVTLDGDDLLLIPASNVPDSLVPELKAHKPEIIRLIKDRQYAQVYPGEELGDEELQEIVRRVTTAGYVLVYCEILDDLVAFYDTEADRAKIPPGFVPYSDAELQHLFGDDKPDMSVNDLKRIHAAKKAGANVVDGG